jgi:hypothetical protein
MAPVCTAQGQPMIDHLAQEFALASILSARVQNRNIPRDPARPSAPS